MTLAKILAVALIIIVLAIPAIGYVAVKYYGTDKLKPIIASIVKEKTGRTLKIDGPIEAGFSFTPSVTLSDITLSNPDWVIQGDMVTIGGIEVALDLRALLSKKLIVDSVVVRDINALLVQEKDRTSWTFNAPAKTQSAAKESAETQDTKRALVDVTIHNITLENASVRYVNGKQDYTVTLPQAQATLEGRPRLQGKALYQNASLDFAFTSQADALDAIMHTPVTILLNASAPQSTVMLEGMVKDLQNNPAFKGNATLNTASLHHFSSVSPSGALPKTEAIIVNAALNATPTIIEANALKAQYGATHISGNVRAELDKAKPYIVANLTIPEYGLVTPKAAPTPQNTTTKNTPKDNVLPLDGLKAVNGAFDVKLDVLKRGSDMLARDITVKSILKDGRLAISRYSASALGGKASGSAVINSAGAGSYSLTSSLSGFTAQQLMQYFTGSSPLSDGPVTAELSLTSAGKSTDAIMRNISGNAHYVLGNAAYTVPQKAGQFGTFLNALRGKQSSNSAISITCSVGKFALNNGQARVQQLLLDTPGAIVVGDGSINIPSRSLAMTFEPRVKRAGLGAITVPINVTGSFSNPSIKADAQGTVKNIAKVGGSILREKAGLQTQVANAMAGIDKASLPAACLTDLPQQPDLTSREGLKKLKDDVKADAKTIEKNVRNVRDSLKQDGKKIEDDVRQIRDSVKGLRNLFKKD